jgi:hypothetical protein
VDPEAGCPNFFEKDSSVTYKRIAVFDNKGEDLIGHMEAAFQFIEHARHHGHVLVHCHKGISRSASFVIGYLMRKNEMTFEEALAHVQSVRPMVQPNDSFIEQLRRYELTLSEQRHREQEAQDSFNHKMDDRANKRARVEVSVGPMLPDPSATPLPSPDTETTVCDTTPASAPAPVEMSVGSTQPSGGEEEGDGEAPKRPSLPCPASDK